MPEKLIEFHLKASVKFLAKDIDDAMNKLSKHFREVMRDGSSDLFIPYSNIEVKPTGSKDIMRYKETMKNKGNRYSIKDRRRYNNV